MISGLPEGLFITLGNSTRGPVSQFTGSAETYGAGREHNFFPNRTVGAELFHPSSGGGLPLVEGLSGGGGGAGGTALSPLSGLSWLNTGSKFLTGKSLAQHAGLPPIKELLPSWLGGAKTVGPVTGGAEFGVGGGGAADALGITSTALSSLPKLAAIPGAAGSFGTAAGGAAHTLGVAAVPGGVANAAVGSGAAAAPGFAATALPIAAAMLPFALGAMGMFDNDKARNEMWRQHWVDQLNKGVPVNQITTGVGTAPTPWEIAYSASALIPDASLTTAGKEYARKLMDEHRGLLDADPRTGDVTLYADHALGRLTGNQLSESLSKRQYNEMVHGRMGTLGM